MTYFEVIQLIAGFIGSLGFGILFNLRGKRLFAGAFGGLISWALFLFIGHFISSEATNYFIVAASMAFYSELMARILKTPASPIVTISLIPLIPGGSLYYTMSSVFESNFNHFFEKAIVTLKLACALALGIIVVSATVKVLFKTPKN